jgi:superfamily II DNA or RNA helicase
MATGTGKTRIALAIATQLINENKIDKIIIQMKGVDLIKQWVGNIDEWRNSKISREVNFLADERDDRDFFLGNFNNPDVDLLLIRQSRLPDLLDKIKDYDQKKTLIIHDEVHDLFAEEISEKILGKQKKFGYKLGLSATIREEFDKARERKLFEEIQGGGDKPAFEYSINDAIADEVLVEMDLIHLEYELDEEEKSKISEKYGIYKKNIDEGMPKWQAESIRNMSIADVKKNAKDKIVVFRNNLSKLLPKLKRSFIFADECDYGDILVNILVPHLNVKTHYNDNKTDKDNLKRFSNKEIDCIINVLKLSQGIDIQSLDTVVLFATPKGRQLIQRLGRVLRIDPNNRNKKAVVIDFFEKKEMKNKKGSEYNRYLQLKEYSKIKKRNL